MEPIMSEKTQNFSYLSDALERQLIEQELRSQAQKAAALAIARGIRRFFSALNGVLVDATEMQARSRSNALRSV